MTVATKFTKFTRDHFHARGIPVEIIRLNGSVELAPVLGLAPFIVDLVETGSTLKANNLVIREELARIDVALIANPAYYKIHFRRIDAFVRLIGSRAARLDMAEKSRQQATVRGNPASPARDSKTTPEAL